jgi:hypothetical protein
MRRMSTGTAARGPIGPVVGVAVSSDTIARGLPST